MADNFSRQTAQQRTYQKFADLVGGNEKTIDLARAALLIASVAYPDLDPVPHFMHLAALAQRVRLLLEKFRSEQSETSAPDTDHPLVLIHALNQVLITEEHFHGNERDYYNPNNSFLNKVLEERTGLPITLSVLYMEVAKRAGIELEGVGFPHHFMVRYRWSEGSIYIDPFANGELLNEAECLERIQKMTQRQHTINPRWLEALSSRKILIRMLNNLKSTYIGNEDFEHALAISDMLLLLQPKAGVEQRDRGFLHLELKHYGRAMHDLHGYLELHPDAKDRYEIRNHIKQIRQVIAQLN